MLLLNASIRILMRRVKLSRDETEMRAYKIDTNLILPKDFLTEA